MTGTELTVPESKDQQLKSQILKDALFCLSLANLLFFKAWVGMHHRFLISSYYKAEPNTANIAILINVLALATVLFVVKRFLWSRNNASVLTIARLGILFLLLVPLEHIRIL